MDVPLFCDTQLKLLATEHTEELSLSYSLLTSLPPALLQSRGLALQNLTLSSTRTGLGGRSLLTLTLDPSITSNSKLPSHGLRSGDIVSVSEQPTGAARKKEKTVLEGRGVEGVVHRVNETSLVVAVSGKGGEGDGDSGVEGLYGKRLWAVQRANEIVMRRMVKAVEQLKELAEKGAMSPLLRVLFGHSESGMPEKVEVKFVDEGLNQSQKEAVLFALGCQDVGMLSHPSPPFTPSPPRHQSRVKD